MRTTDHCYSVSKKNENNKFIDKNGNETETERDYSEFYSQRDYDHISPLLKESMSKESASTQEVDQVLSTIDKVIENGAWTDDAIDEFDELLEKIDYEGENDTEQVRYAAINDRLNSELAQRQRKAVRVNQAHAGASILLGRSQSANRQNNVEGLSAVEKLNQQTKQRRKNENVVMNWAKEEGYWFNDYSDENGNPYSFLDDCLTDIYGEQIGEGSESKVHLSEDGKYVIKALSNVASKNGDLTDLFDKIAMHNMIFDTTPIEIIGFGRTKDGQFRVVVKQPYIKGEKITSEEAEQYLESIGLKSNKEHKQTLFDGKITISDISHPENRGNIIKDKNGNYYVIDADIMLSDEYKQQLPTADKI